MGRSLRGAVLQGAYFVHVEESGADRGFVASVAGGGVGAEQGLDVESGALLAGEEVGEGVLDLDQIAHEGEAEERKPFLLDVGVGLRGAAVHGGEHEGCGDAEHAGNRGHVELLRLDELDVLRRHEDRLVLEPVAQHRDAVLRARRLVPDVLDGLGRLRR
ncbi:hypothetical protein ABE10_03785 [Bacillus toyonensis]|nr:hypothetical protein [Bacillus toyonensis]